MDKILIQIQTLFKSLKIKYETLGDIIILDKGGAIEIEPQDNSKDLVFQFYLSNEYGYLIYEENYDCQIDTFDVNIFSNILSEFILEVKRIKKVISSIDSKIDQIVQLAEDINESPETFITINWDFN